MIYITGAAGFVGSNLAMALSNYSQNVMLIDNLFFGNRENLPRGTELDLMDFNDAIPNGGTAQDILVHLATTNLIYAVLNPVPTFINNAQNTLDLFRRFRGRIIYTSTASVYNNAQELPTKEDAPIKTYTAYDASKRVAEQYLISRGGYTTLRLSNVYGPKQQPSSPFSGVIGKLVHCALTGETFKIYGNGENTRDYTFVEDVVEALEKAIQMPPTNTEINIGTGDETSTNELIRLVSQLTGKTINTTREPEREIDCIQRRCMDVSKAKKVLHWEPKTHIGIGLIRTIEWQKYKDHNARLF